MRDEVLDGGGGGGERVDVVGLVVVDGFADVVGLEFDGGEDGAVADGTVGAEEGEVVGEVGGGDSEVGFRFVGP